MVHALKTKILSSQIKVLKKKLYIVSEKQTILWASRIPKPSFAFYGRRKYLPMLVVAIVDNAVVVLFVVLNNIGI